MNLLLVSSSKTFGTGYLDHVEAEVTDLFPPDRAVLFVPFALGDWDAYAGMAAKRFQAMGLELISAHRVVDPEEALAGAGGVFVGGGNTFRLLLRLYEGGWIGALRRAVLDRGLPYMGTSAGSNVACPTIKTTNDMPIVEPPTFDALNFVPFQINPHYLDPEPGSRHMGETRETRIREYHEENDLDVVGLREGSWIRVRGEDARLGGAPPARIFKKGREPVELPAGSHLGSALGFGG